jgi:hypothetical protein
MRVRSMTTKKNGWVGEGGQMAGERERSREIEIECEGESKGKSESESGVIIGGSKTGSFAGPKRRISNTMNTTAAAMEGQVRGRLEGVFACVGVRMSVSVYVCKCVCVCVNVLCV